MQDEAAAAGQRKTSEERPIGTGGMDSEETRA